MKSFDAVYKDGVLRPLEALDLPENGRVHVTVNGPDAEPDWLDTDCHRMAASLADADVSLDDVRQALRSISGSLADTVIAERDER